jgi:hypothetical protein
VSIVFTSLLGCLTYIFFRPCIGTDPKLISPHRSPPLDRQFVELIKWYREDDYASNTCPLSSAMQSAQNGRSISHSDLVALLRAALVLG